MSALSQTKILDGSICKICVNKLPKSIRKNLHKYSLSNLETITDYMDSLNKDLFFPTASFGSLHIDEIHGLFAISEKLDDNDYSNLTDIFYCLNLIDVGLTPTNVKVDKRNQVYCDFELHCWFKYPECSFTVPIRKNVKCPSKNKNKTELTYEMPGDYHIFLKMFNQMLDTARQKYKEMTEPQFISKSRFDLFKAETMFMLSDAYDRKEVETQKDILMGAFEGQENYQSIIMHAYHLLMNNIKD